MAQNEASRRIDESVENKIPSLAPFLVQDFLDWVLEQAPEPEPLEIPKWIDGDGDPFHYGDDRDGDFLIYDEFLQVNGLHHLDNTSRLHAEPIDPVPVEHYTDLCYRLRLKVEWWRWLVTSSLRQLLSSLKR